MVGIGRSKRPSRAGPARICGPLVVRWVAQAPVLPSGGRWNRSQLGQGAAELGFPEPVLRKVQSEAARRAGEPSRQGEEPPPEGLGGNHLLTQADVRRPAAQVVGSGGPGKSDR